MCQGEGTFAGTYPYKFGNIRCKTCRPSDDETLEVRGYVDDPRTVAAFRGPEDAIFAEAG